VVAKVIQRLSVSKQAVQKFNVERFNCRKLIDVEVKEDRLKSQIGLWLWKTWRRRRRRKMLTSFGLGKVLEYKSFSTSESGLL
jgi:hypothetical protein